MSRRKQVALVELEDTEPMHIEYHPRGGKLVNAPLKRYKPDDPVVIQTLCRGIVAGEGLNRILKKNPGFPHPFAIHNAIIDNPNSDLAVGIARAREEAHHAILAKCEELAASITPENIEVVTKQIWWHQWHLAKLKPRKYSEKHFVESTVHEAPKLTKEEFTDIAYRIVDEV